MMTDDGIGAIMIDEVLDAYDVRDVYALARLAAVE